MKFRHLLFVVLLVCGVANAQSPDPLRILVYGATGNVGTHIVDEALARGHLVTAVSRDPSRITKQHDNLSVVAGDLLDTDSIAALLKDKDAIVVSVRGIIGSDRKPENALQYIAVKNIVAELRAAEAGDTRLIHVGGSGSLEVEPGVLWADKIPKMFVPKNLELEIQGQILTLEYLRTIDDVDWSYATPAKNFTNGERTGVFRIGGDAVMEDEHGKSRISRADFAVAILDEAELANHRQKRFSVAY
jgi:putative NADH-flavin reductase